MNETPRFGDGRTEAEEKADDSRMIREGMQAAFPPLTYLDSQLGPAFPPQPERNRDYQVRPDWSPPPPDCPVIGWPQIDRPDLGMCSCGHRHITFTIYGGGGPGGEQ